MRLRGWRSVATITTLGLVAAVATTPYPVRAYMVVQEFERASKGGTNVSFWERVVYSLIEARDRDAACRAPRTT